MPDLTFGSIALMPVIVGIVEFAKRYFGLQTKHAPIATAILSVIGYAVIVITQQNPDLSQPAEHAIQAIIVFLGSSGLYSVGKSAAGK